MLSGDQDESFLLATSRKLLAYEAALRGKKADALPALYDEQVTYLGQELGRDEVMKKHAEAFEKMPENAFFFDHCSIRIEGERPPKSLLAECSTIVHGAEGPRPQIERLIFGGPEGKLRSVGDAAIARKREEKERIRSFLPSSLSSSR